MAVVTFKVGVPNCPASATGMSPIDVTRNISASAVTLPTFEWICHYPAAGNTRHFASGSSFSAGTGMWRVDTVTFDAGGMTDEQLQALLAAINGTTSAVNTTSTNEVLKIDAGMNYGVVALAAALFVAGFVLGYRLTFRRGGM